ncbi:MAG: hypothetical protein HQM10_09125 [Candidatus Riflebacteria bacterium]|nr:hypothetical protein [Candidatus Riflebacteria bacterium]
MKRLPIAILALSLGIFSFWSSRLCAWDNVKPHTLINEYAWKLYHSWQTGEKSDPVHGILIDRTYHGTTVKDGGNQDNALFGNRLSPVYAGTELQDVDWTPQRWVIHGGFSADVPNIDRARRHFWDPLVGHESFSDGKLRDGNPWVGLCSAWFWTFSLGNAYSWSNALRYYAQSMEGEADGKPLTDEERNAALGKAFKALGETLHMYADMACPSHVRDDNHLAVGGIGDPDPIEASVEEAAVKIAWSENTNAWQGLIPDGVKIRGVDPETLFENIARFTNRSFLTDDTIYSRISPTVKPLVGKVYQSPQLCNLEPPDEDGAFYTSIPMVPFGSGGSPSSARIRLARKASAWNWSRWLWRVYEVPGVYGKEQAKILIPLAVRAGAEMIGIFFPTMTLTTNVVPQPARIDEKGRRVKVEAKLIHEYEKDRGWKLLGDPFHIRFSGKGRLVPVLPDGKTAEPIPLTFTREVCSQIVVLPPEAKARVEVEAGGRLFVSGDMALPPTELENVQVKPNSKPDGKTGPALCSCGKPLGHPGPRGIRCRLGDRDVSTSGGK